MQHAYDEYNDRVRATGKSRGHFMVDLCRPGHLTACLRNFQEATGCSDENWESQFSASSPSMHLLFCTTTWRIANGSSKASIDLQAPPMQCW